MKLLAAQPASRRFQWELEVLLTNLRQLDHFDLEVVLLFGEKEFGVAEYFVEHYPEVEVHLYPDTRTARSYSPTIRPHLWQKYLAEDNTREQDDYLYVDSDIIFREWLDLTTVDPEAWAASLCRRSTGKNYVDYDYVSHCKQGSEIAEKIAEVCGVTMEQFKAAPGVGAQWIMRKPTVAYWQRVEDDCNALWDYFSGMDTDIQTWVCDMWAHLLGAIRMGKTVVEAPDMTFCVSTDPVEKWNQNKILHNAGVRPPNHKGLFFKGAYKINSPFGSDFSFVDPNRASIKYVEALQKVVH